MRHVKPGLTAADQIGTDLFGLPVWQLSGHDDDDTAPDGGDDDDSDVDDEDEDEEDEDDDSSDDDGKGKKKPKHAKDDDEDDDDSPMYSKKEYDKLRARMRAADKRASDAETRLSRRGTRKPPADDKTTPPVDEAATKRAAQAEAELKQTRLEVAFLRASDVDWIDSADALRLVDLSDVDVDEDGTVDTKALARALKALAKRKPHLIKAKKASGPAGDDGDDDADQRSGGPTAPKMNGKRSGRKPSTQDQLTGKFSALRNR